MFLDHRTIRKFSSHRLDPTCLTRLITVAQHTATSHFLQSFSIIHITDPNVRAQIAVISKQAYINGNGELLIFVADQYRASLCADTPNTLGSADKFIQATSDTLLAAQNLVNAAEAQGLGTVILGSILNDPMQLIALLHLPKFTFPICGVIVGYPDQVPQFKPRLPQALMNFENSYVLPDDWQTQLADYDQVIARYYATRDTNRREETFSHLLANGAAQTPAKRGELLHALHAQGFLTAVQGVQKKT